MALVVSAASAFDFAEALDDRGLAPVALTRQRFGLFARQVGGGGAATIRDAAGGLVMIAGLFHAEGYAEAWWAVGPAARANLWPALKILRMLLGTIGRECAPLEVRAHVRPDSVAGHRLAPLFGFEAAGETTVPILGRLRVWRRVFAEVKEDRRCLSSPSRS